MSYAEDPLAGETQAPTKEPHLALLTGRNQLLAIPPGACLTVMLDPDTTTPHGKIPLVLIKVDKSKWTFICGCPRCMGNPRKARVFTLSGRWTGNHA